VQHTMSGPNVAPPRGRSGMQISWIRGDILTGKCILVTGAGGNIGDRICAHLAARGYTLRKLCLNPRSDPGIITCDLARYDNSWVQHFDGADAVIHLAGEPSPFADWDRVLELNVDLTLNVLAASHRYGVKRFVFASSNHVMAGHRYSATKLSEAMAPCPISAYGATKVFGERVGKLYADRYGISFVSLRIGASPNDDARRRGARLPFGAWGQAMWLSDRDLCEGFEKAITNKSIKYGIYNLMSANPGMRWPLDAIKADLGFEPQDSWPAQVTVFERAKAGMAWIRDIGAPTLMRRLTRPRW
jgi:NAD+ dependent glucose-6-phosphate dehydrogenase